MPKKEPPYGLTAQKIEDIRNAYRDGMTLVELHHFFNVPIEHLFNIVRHRPWNPETEEQNKTNDD
jgi:hypothetical protein